MEKRRSGRDEEEHTQDKPCLVNGLARRHCVQDAEARKQNEKCEGDTCEQRRNQKWCMPGVESSILVADGCLATPAENSPNRVDRSTLRTDARDSVDAFCVRPS